MVTSLARNIQRSLPVVVRQISAGPRPEQQPHGLGLILYDAVMERGVALLGLPVKAAGVLDQEVHDVEAAPGLLGDGVMEAGLLKLRVGQGVSQVAAEEVTLCRGLEQVLKAVIVHGGLQLSVELPGGGAVGLHIGAVAVLGPDVRLPLLHRAARAQLPVRGGLHDLVEPLVGHRPGHQELAGPDVVQSQGLDLCDVDPHLPVNARTLDTDNNTEVDSEPGDVTVASAITALVIGGNIPDVIH